MTHLFGISQGSISTNIDKIALTVWACLPVPQNVYEKSKKCSTIEDLDEFFPGLVALTDVSERLIQRPKRSDMEESHYAKAKTYIVKIQYTMSFDGLIVHKTAHSPGRRHDFKIYKIKHPTFPDSLPCRNEENQGKFRRDRLRHYSDTAYVAMGKIISWLDYTTPFKRKPSKNLTSEQRTFNRAHFRVHIRVENGVRRVKVFRIMKEMYRNKLKKYDRINDIAYGVVNQTILLKRDGIL